MIELLTDKTGVLVALVNVTPQPGFLLCGLAYFMGGLKGVIETSDGNQTYIIKVPEPVAFVSNPITFAHPNDLYEIQLDANSSS
ncbi:MAG: hypothetical protein F6K31_12920 [Symploca sp. SIO2G7]|nr:hypothetical protein [Symploca sp. SIO2G7]